MIGGEEKGDGASHIEHHDSSGKANGLRADDDNAGASSLPLSEASENSRQGRNHVVQSREELQGPQRNPFSGGRDAIDA
jgi:hypothetical protein